MVSLSLNTFWKSVFDNSAKKITIDILIVEAKDELRRNVSSDIYVFWIWVVFDVCLMQEKDKSETCVNI